SAAVTSAWRSPRHARSAGSTSPSSTCRRRRAARLIPPGGGSSPRRSVAGVGGDGDGRACAVVTAAGKELPADLVVLGLGVRPNVALAKEAGIPLGTSGGVAVDKRMRTEIDGVWSAGDCVESVHRLSGQRVVVALGTHDNKQGRVAGINIGG